MSKQRPRRPVEQRMSNGVRKHVAALERAERRAEKAARLVTLHREWLANHVAAESERFGVQVPADPFVLDVLAGIEVTTTGEWLWRGGSNNKGTATVRCPRGEVGDRTVAERTVVRVLAEAFGVITPGDNGSLYPLGSRDDVNPFNRRLRRSEKPLGNPDRYQRKVA